MEWMLLPLKRYAQFTGRSRPKEYWLFWLFTVIMFAILSAIESTLGIGSGMTQRSASDGIYGFSTYHNAGWLVGLFALSILVPSLAVAIRRLHDTDRSGWWLLIGLIPLIGAIVLFVFMVTGGTRGPNRFGPDPVLADRPDTA